MIKQAAARMALGSGAVAGSPAQATVSGSLGLLGLTGL
jgi:hypothetical protein